MNEKINQVSQKIFRIFNEEYFSSKLPKVLYRYRGKRIVITKSVRVHTDEGTKYIITLPLYSIITEYYLASYIFESMMFLEEYIERRSPIRYRGRSYRTLVKKKDCNIICKNNGSEYGFEIEKGSFFFKEFCIKNHIRKNWSTLSNVFEEELNKATKEKRFCSKCNNWFYVPSGIIKDNYYITCSTCTDDTCKY